MPNRFNSITQHLTTNVDNITSGGIVNVLGITNAEYINTATGKFYDYFMPNISITSVTVVADLAARDLLTVETGDVAVVLSDADGDKSTYIYDGYLWTQIFTNYLLNSLTDVNTAGVANNSLLRYDSINAVWQVVQGPTAAQITSYVNTLNQSVNSSANPTFEYAIMNNHLRINQQGTIAWPGSGIGALAFEAGVVVIKDDTGVFSLRALKTDSHTHSNKISYLDPIDQLLNISATPTFEYAIMNNHLRINQQGFIAWPGAGIGALAFEAGVVVIKDDIGTFSTRGLYTNSHTHSNKISYLDPIDQLLNISATPTFEYTIMNNHLRINQQGTIAWPGSGIGALAFELGAITVKDDTGTFSLRSLKTDSHTHDQLLNTVNSPTFVRTKIGGIDSTANNLQIYESTGAQAHWGFNSTTQKLNFLLTPNLAYIYQNNTTSDIVIGGTSGTNVTFQTTTKAVTFGSGGVTFIGNSTNTYGGNTTNQYQGSYHLNRLSSGGFMGYLNNSGSTYRATLYENGTANFQYMVVGVGTSGSSNGYSLFVDGAGSQASTSATTFVLYSDQRSKTNIFDLTTDDIMESFAQIRFVNYTHIYQLDKVKTGIIADEVLLIPRYACCVSVKPEAKFKLENGEEVIIPNCLDFSMDCMLWDSLKVTQMQITEIQTLKDTVAAQAVTIATLEAKMANVAAFLLTEFDIII